MIDVNWKPTDRQLRQFAVAFLVFAGLLGGLLAYRGDGIGTASKVLWGLGPLVALVGLAAPRAIRPLYLALTLLAYPIGLVIGTVLLAITFYLVLTPVALLFKVLGNDPMRRRFDRQAESYWVRRPPNPPAERYLRQF